VVVLLSYTALVVLMSNIHRAAVWSQLHVISGAPSAVAYAEVDQRWSPSVAVTCTMPTQRNAAEQCLLQTPHDSRPPTESSRPHSSAGAVAPIRKPARAVSSGSSSSSSSVC
jgi:hypothetical protein